MKAALPASHIRRARYLTACGAEPNAARSKNMAGYAATCRAWANRSIADFEDRRLMRGRDVPVRLRTEEHGPANSNQRYCRIIFRKGKRRPFMPAFEG